MPDDVDRKLALFVEKVIGASSTPEDTYERLLKWVEKECPNPKLAKLKGGGHGMSREVDELARWFEKPLKAVRARGKIRAVGIDPILGTAHQITCMFGVFDQFELVSRDIGYGLDIYAKTDDALWNWRPESLQHIGKIVPRGFRSSDLDFTAYLGLLYGGVTGKMLQLALERIEWKVLLGRSTERFFIVQRHNPIVIGAVRNGEFVSGGGDRL